VQGAAWSADSRSILFLAPEEQSALRLWAAPLDGGPAALIPEFSDAGHWEARACALTGDQFLYTFVDGTIRVLGEFPLQPALHAAASVAAAPSRLDMSGCAASSAGVILADAVDSRSSVWTLPIDAESGAVRGPLASLIEPKHDNYSAQFSPDGGSFLSGFQQTTFLQDYRTGLRKPLPGAINLSSDGLFVLQVSEPMAGTTPEIRKVLNLKTGESWGRLQGGAVNWDLSRGGQWILSASTEAHRAIMAWDTRTAEHRAIYAHPNANLYLASFSNDARWALFTSEESDGRPHMWAAPFRGLQNVAAAEWVDLGEGDYPRWSPAGGRIYFTQMHDGFECIFTRAVDPETKRPAGPVTAIRHFHGRLTPLNLRPGTFRLSVAQDKIAFALGERTHRLLQWR